MPSVYSPSNLMKPLLMIPGPVELSPKVAEAAAALPPGHMSPAFVETFARALQAMRVVFAAGSESQPFVTAGSGTTAMDMAAANLVEPGTRALVLWSGYFSDRMAEILRRYGAHVTVVYPGGDAAFDEAMIGRAPGRQEVEQALKRHGDHALLFATHVDTSTGVRVDAEPLAKLARARGMLSVFDGVCAAAGERFDMDAWGADVYLTASQKALGLPPGLALLVASSRALAARKARRSTPPPLVLDWEQWLPIMRGYEEKTPKYFATPATGLIVALDASLQELLAIGMNEVFERQKQAALRVRGALSLESLVRSPDDAAYTLSAFHLPKGKDASFVKQIAANGVIVAGGLIAPIAPRYFRVGHMGHAARTPLMIERTIDAINAAL